jgi:hypothetical protein
MEKEKNNFSDDLNTSKIAAVGFISVIIVFALIILVQVLFYWTEANQRIVKDIDQPYLEYANLTADQQAKLAKYQWLDEKEKIVAIPIRRAMELVVDELSKPSASMDIGPAGGESPKEKAKSHVQ